MACSLCFLPNVERRIMVIILIILIAIVAISIYAIYNNKQKKTAELKAIREMMLRQEQIKAEEASRNKQNKNKSKKASNKKQATSSENKPDSIKPICLDESHTFLKAELILLREISNRPKEENGDVTLPHYLEYVYGIEHDTAYEYLRMFLKYGFLELEPLDKSIRHKTIPQIKEVLSTKSVKVSGKKDIQIKALYDNFSSEELKEIFPPTCYVLTLKAEELLAGQLDPDDWKHRYEDIDFNEAKREINKLIFQEAYKNTILYTDTPYDNVPEYVQRNKEIFICTLMYADGWSSAKRILRRIYHIEDTEHYVEKYECFLRSEKEMRDCKEFEALDAKYSICTCGNDSACDYCASMEGKHILINQAIVGVNFPPFSKCTCDYCRCWTRPVLLSDTEEKETI